MQKPKTIISIFFDNRACRNQRPLILFILVKSVMY